MAGAMDDVSERIARLEAEIIDLADQAENCRKVMIAARFGMIGGAVALALFVTGLLRFDGMVFVVAVTAILVGIVSYGSNKSTREQLLAGIAERRAARDALIDMIGPSTVTDSRNGPRLLH